MTKRTPARLHMARLVAQWRVSGASRASCDRRADAVARCPAICFFLFRYRHDDRLKILAWDRFGFWILYKRLEDQVNASLTQERLIAMLSGFFGALALLLEGLGLYGVTSYAVSRRRHEIGIRRALGAEPAGVVRLVLARVSALVALGVGWAPG